jgi:hypothetical protein
MGGVQAFSGHDLGNALHSQVPENARCVFATQEPLATPCIIVHRIHHATCFSRRFLTKETFERDYLNISVVVPNSSSQNIA